MMIAHRLYPSNLRELHPGSPREPRLRILPQIHIVSLLVARHLRTGPHWTHSMKQALWSADG